MVGPRSTKNLSLIYTAQDFDLCLTIPRAGRTTRFERAKTWIFRNPCNGKVNGSRGTRQRQADRDQSSRYHDYRRGRASRPRGGSSTEKGKA